MARPGARASASRPHEPGGRGPLMAAPLGPRRRADPQPEPGGARSRTAAQGHLDARLARLRAYTAALETALAALHPDARRAQLEGQLAQARRDIRHRGGPRLQRAAPARAAQRTAGRRPTPMARAAGPSATAGADAAVARSSAVAREATGRAICCVRRWPLRRPGSAAPGASLPDRGRPAAPVAPGRSASSRGAGLTPGPRSRTSRRAARTRRSPGTRPRAWRRPARAGSAPTRPGR